jgi:hypothetical protein
MKLTKGKVAKIINKKNQSLKRNKKQLSKKNKIKTFRKRKHINLHSRSLKKYSGGIVEAKEPEKKDNVEVTQPSSEYEDPTKLEIVNQEASLNKTENTEEDSLNKKENTEEDTLNKKENTEEDSLNKKENAEEVSLNKKENAEEDTLNKTENTEEVVPVTKMMDNMDDQPANSEENLKSNEEQSQTPILPEEPVSSEESSGYGSDEENSLVPEGYLEKDEPSAKASLDQEQPSVEEPTVSSEETTQQTSPIENDVSIVAESLDKLAEYISDKIAKKLKNVSFAPSNELNNDAFNALANANEALADA